MLPLDPNRDANRYPQKGSPSLAGNVGEVFQGAKSYKQHEKKLASLQYLLRKKETGSANYRKAQLKIAKLHRRIANIRLDTLHKLTTYISKNHAVIGLENLNVSGMMANRKLAKAIGDMGFYEFRRGHFAQRGKPPHASGLVSWNTRVNSTEVGW